MPNEHESTFHDHLHQGDVLRDEGQLAEAESAYKAALAVDPADTNAHYKLFDLYLKMGREHEAMHELDRLPEKKWDFSQATPAFVPESEPEIQETQYEEAEAAPRESPAVQPLGAGSESVSAPQEPLPPQSPDTTPDLDRPPRAFSEATPLEDAWTQPEVLVPEKPPQAVYEQERQRDQVEPVEPVEPVETGEAWEIDQPSRLAAAEIPHTASEQNVASAQIPDQAQHSSGHSLFNLPEDDAEEEFEAVEQEFAEEFAEDFSEDTFPQEATKKSRLSSMFSSLSSKIGRRNNQDEYDGPYEEYEQDEDYEQHDGQYESAELDGHNKYDGQNAYGEHDAPDTHDEYDEYDEYDDMDPVLLDDRPPRPWWHWLAGLGILATLLYAAWQFFFAAPLPAPSSPAPSSSQGAETDPLSQSFYPTGEAADRSDFSEPAVQDPSVPASPDTPPEYSREYSQEYPQENLGKYPEETVSPVAPLGTESSLGGAASQDVPAPSSVVSQNAAAEPASFFTEAEALSQPARPESVSPSSSGSIVGLPASGLEEQERASSSSSPASGESRESGTSPVPDRSSPGRRLVEEDLPASPLAKPPFTSRDQSQPAAGRPADRPRSSRRSDDVAKPSSPASLAYPGVQARPLKGEQKPLSGEHIVHLSPGIYQVVRDTRLFKESSQKSMPLAWLPKGIKVQVVEVVAGRWLKIQPRNPNRPSGFLRQDDVTTLTK